MKIEFEPCMKVEIKCKGSDTANIKDLLHFQGELKSLSDENYIKFKGELLELGFSEPISVWINEGKKYILNGHMRRKALINMMSEGIIVPDLPINIVEADDIKQAKRKVLALTSQYGQMSSDSLLDFCEKNELNFDEMLNDFRFPELESISLDIIAEPEETAGDDDVNEDVEPITKLGDLWELGEHRLLCGDSTNEANLSRLKGSSVIDLIFIDPMYQDRVDSIVSAIDMIDCNDILIMCTMKQAFSFNEVSGWVFCFDLVLNQLIPSSMLNKKVPYYLHKNIMYFMKNKRETIFDCDNAKGVFSDKGYVPSVIESAKQTGSAHGLSKNVDGIIKILAGFKFKSLFDGFVGSGSTLVACEKTGRACFCMDIEPKYCDIVVNRYVDWRKLNGRSVNVKLNGKKWGGYDA